MIAIFKISYWFVAILQFIVTVAAIIILAVKRTDIVNNCAALYPEETVDTCSIGYRNFMIIFSVVSILINFIQVLQIARFSHTISFLIWLFLFSSISPQPLAHMLQDCVEQICTKSFVIWKISLSPQAKLNSFKTTI